jgi:hypothetical protein
LEEDMSLGAIVTWIVFIAVAIGTVYFVRRHRADERERRLSQTHSNTMRQPRHDEQERVRKGATGLEGIGSGA